MTKEEIKKQLEELKENEFLLQDILFNDDASKGVMLTKVYKKGDPIIKKYQLPIVMDVDEDGNIKVSVNYKDQFTEKQCMDILEQILA